MLLCVDTMMHSTLICVHMQTLLENLEPYDEEIQALVTGELETMPQIFELEKKLAILGASHSTAHNPRASMVSCWMHA